MRELRLNQFRDLLAEHALEDGENKTLVNDVMAFRVSSPYAGECTVYEPLICLIGQGEKTCVVGEHEYTYGAGDLFINFLPVPAKGRVISATHEQPFLGAAIRINLPRLADLVLKLDQLGIDRCPEKPPSHSSVLTGKASEDIVDAFTRLMRIANTPYEADILSNAVFDEIYYRILTGEQGGALCKLLNQHGQIQSVAKTIQYIHGHIDQAININDLASQVHMSKTSFYDTFKSVMHMPPLQYIKSSKLQRAQVLIKEGKRANEASHRVGYKSFSQFSREYKRHFGYAPSETLAPFTKWSSQMN
ncbi:AraC family transcriptional regulator [Endozoicomonadaceae bacterium StTr2]